jgi:hypothetical protein
MWVLECTFSEEPVAGSFFVPFLKSFFQIAFLVQGLNCLQVE